MEGGILQKQPQVKLEVTVFRVKPCERKGRKEVEQRKT